MKLKTLKDIPSLKDKKVLVRVAYDVPIAKQGKGYRVADDRRIRETLPTLKYLLKQGATLVLVSWLGRPDGKHVERLKMDPVARHLEKLLKHKVDKFDDCVGPDVEKKLALLPAKSVVLLENTRFHPGEERNSSVFSRQLVAGVDLIVFDAYAQAHRTHASTTGILTQRPAYAGLLFEKEMAAIEEIITPKRPFLLVIGGAKISDKVGALEFLASRADWIMIGGGAANIFLKAMGIPVADSYVEDNAVGKNKSKKSTHYIRLAKRLLKEYPQKFILPIDLVAGNSVKPKALTEIVDFTIPRQEIKKGWMFLDIGPKTIKRYKKVIIGARTVFWNGPMGVFELPIYEEGTKQIAKAIAANKHTTVLGGGDTESVVERYSLAKKFTHVSTGGGATLHLLSGKDFPIIKYLQK